MGESARAAHEGGPSASIVEWLREFEGDAHLAGVTLGRVRDRDGTGLQVRSFGATRAGADLAVDDLEVERRQDAGGGDLHWLERLEVAPSLTLRGGEAFDDVHLVARLESRAPHANVRAVLETGNGRNVELTWSDLHRWCGRGRGRGRTRQREGNRRAGLIRGWGIGAHADVAVRKVARRRSTLRRAGNRPRHDR